MRWVLRIGGGAILVVLAALIGAAFWFWFTPVGLTNYINKAVVRYALTSPQDATAIGLVDGTPLDFHSGRLNRYTREAEQDRVAVLEELERGLARYGPEGLDPDDRLSWDLAAYVFADYRRAFETGGYGYWVDHFNSPPVALPRFLTDTHTIRNEKTAITYLARLGEVDRVLAEVSDRFREDAAEGRIPPRFVFDRTMSVIRNFIEGGADANVLVTTLPERLDAAGIRGERAEEITREARRVVADEVIPAYEGLIALLEEYRPEASPAAGIWDVPGGERIYAAALKSSTTTDLSADAIHDIGLREVARIEGALDPLLAGEGLIEGTVGERIRQLANDPANQFVDSAAGRAAFLRQLQDMNDALIAEAPQFFAFIPPQPVIVTAVPSYEQDTKPLAFYLSPALDGSRPGRAYFNLRDPSEAPVFAMKTVLYHEASPGHHFQIAYAQKLEDVPILRRVWNTAAYAEGWALYAEWIAKNDFDVYQDDPLGEIGQLRAEMWRAVRLVVDTGIHHKRWTREQAIAYMQNKVGMTRDAARTEVDRYVVSPGQATAYKIGELTIRRLRSRAEAELGPNFDIAGFHSAILGHGALPLELVERQVETWIKTEKRESPA